MNFIFHKDTVFGGGSKADELDHIPISTAGLTQMLRTLSVLF